MNYRNFDAETLEREYTPASRVENIQVYLDSYTQRGQSARQTISHQKLTYGNHPDEWLWYAPAGDTQNNDVRVEPLIIFVHGGFWRRLSADDGTFLTPKFHELGFSTACVNYSLCPTETLDVLVDQTSRAIEFLSTRHHARNTILIGHSAGAQLIAMAMCEKSASQFATAIFVSGVFDLEPIIHMSVNDAVKLDLESARRLSPINFTTQAKNTPIAVIWGENETNEFKRQSREFATTWSSSPNHSSAKTREITGRNHFDVLDELASPGVIGLADA